MNPRRAVYQALLTVYRGEGFFSDQLSHWKTKSHPSDRDFRFAYDLGLGTIRKTWSLDAIARNLSDKGKLSLKLKEKVLVRMAIYQSLFMDSVPHYAAADQMMKIASSTTHPHFSRFFNVILHKLEHFTWNPSEPSEQFALPPQFVDKLIAAYGSEKAFDAMHHLNQIHPPMIRKRPTTDYFSLPKDKKLRLYTENPRFYVQNATPIHLIDQLHKDLPQAPSRILDLCASPGGKSILLHDLFPDAELIANEIAPARIPRLQQNFSKYSIPATILNEDGTTIQPGGHFDLIVLDVPCSNSGVLGKKPEARLRLDQEHLNQLIDLQKKLLTQATHLLTKDGRIWYLTCSILPEEHHHAIPGLKAEGEPITILPNADGWDGGFATALVLDT